MRPMVMLSVLTLTMLSVPNGSASDGCEQEDPVEMLVCMVEEIPIADVACIGAFEITDPEEISAEVRHFGVGPHQGEGVETLTAGMAMANEGGRSPGTHTSFVLLGATTEMDDCEPPEKSYDRIISVADYWNDDSIVFILCHLTGC